MSAWKGGVADVTDEEWIPQHRIMYFRKKGDEEEGRRVWDRATRLDRLFGSGVAPVAPFEGRREGEKTEEDEIDVAMEELGDGGNAHVTSETVS